MASFPSLEVSGWGLVFTFLMSMAWLLYRLYFSKRAQNQPRSRGAQVIRIALFLILLVMALIYVSQLREIIDFIQSLSQESRSLLWLAYFGTAQNSPALTGVG